ncbi:unnamed protein product, partial [Discosporangium mesarthrocarpum]
HWLAVRECGVVVGVSPSEEIASAPAKGGGQGGTLGGLSSLVPGVRTRAGVGSRARGEGRGSRGGSTTPTGRHISGVGAGASIGIQDDALGSASGRGGEETAPPDVGVSAEGVWVEWSPALLFVAGRSAAMVMSCLSTAGMLPPPSLQGPYTAAGDSLYRASGSGLKPIPIQGQEEGKRQGEEPGPALGFPGAALGLPPLSLTSRALSCFDNTILLQKPSTGAATAGAPGGSGAVGVPGTRAGAQESPGAVAGFRVLVVTVRGICLEIPYVARMDLGDIEHGDVLRWLRGFQGVSRGGVGGHTNPGTSAGP